MSSASTDPIRARLLDWAFKPGAGVDQRGQPLAWSLDCRELTLHGPTLQAIAERLWTWVDSYEAALIAGPSLSADPIVAALLLSAQAHGVELRGALLRREPKTYGLRKLFEGPPVRPGMKAVVVDDVLNSGTSANRVIRALRDSGVDPVAVLTIVDLGRQRRNRDDGVDYRSLYRAADLGLEPAEDAAAAVACAWTERGVNSAIPDTHVTAPLFAGRYTVLAGNRRGVLVVDAKGRIMPVDGEPVLLAACMGNDLILAGASSLRCVTVDNLQTRWTRDLRASVLCCSRTGHVFVVHEGDRMFALSAATGATRASRLAAQRIEGLHDCAGNLVAIAGSEVQGLDEALATRWSWPRRAVSVAAPGSGKLFALTSDSELVRIDPRSGRVAWVRGMGRGTSPRIAAEGNSIVCAVDSMAMGLSIAGVVEWIRSAPSRIVAGPVDCGPGWVAIADRTGCVHVLDKKNGTRVAVHAGLRLRPLVLAGSRDRLAGIDSDGTAWGLDLAIQSRELAITEGGDHPTVERRGAVMRNPRPP